MQPFLLERPHDLAAIAAADARAGCNDACAEYIAGGTDMVQLLREHVRRPTRLVDLCAGAAALDGRVELDSDGMLRLGALATMADAAEHALVREHAPLIAQALLASASQQVRNVATVAGNLLQRTRCGYFRDAGVASCNKRIPGSGCAALDGEHRGHAIFGTSEHCIATHASDLAVALAALDAQLQLHGPAGARTLPVLALHRLPGDTPHLEAALQPGEVIVAIRLAVPASPPRACYLKVRDRASFEFALVSVAVQLELDGDRIERACLAAGGVGTKPWRLAAAEDALRGRPVEAADLRAAAERAVDGAAPRRDNAFKVELLKRTVVRAVQIAAGAA